LPPTLKVGEERPIIFLSDALGITLNRGSDGVVRVMSVVPDNPGSSIVRTGYIQVGDVIREAAGVDIRRPITNIMWGDTVALIKMAPRPITLIVARELSAIPVSVHDERRLRNPLDRSPIATSTYKRPYTIAEI
jgi:C-terminal processing protease CtpA/Prc